MTELEKTLAEASEYKSEFYKFYKGASIVLAQYCEAMERAQKLTSKLHQPGLGGNVEAENKLAALLFKEPPIQELRREGYEPTMGWGWNLSCDIVPMVQKKCADAA